MAIQPINLKFLVAIVKVQI